jgi:hypothetical protein
MSKTDATELVVLITDNGTSFADQVIYIRQNPLSGSDVQTQAENAIDAKYSAVSGTADSGTTTTLVDDALTQDDDDWNGYALEVAFSGQTEIRCIRDFVASTDTVTVAPAFVGTVSTDTYRILIEPACRLIETTDFNSGAIDATAIAASAIGASEIATDAIGAAELATDAIGAAELATDAIGAAELAADAVDEIVADISAMTIDGTIDLQCAIALTFAYTSGKWTRSGNVVTYRNPGDTANRLVGTITANTSFDTITRTCP